MRRAVAAAILIVSGLTLQGCMPPKMVRTSATAFYVPEYKAAGTIAVLSSDSKTAESLEFAHFRSLVEAKLRTAGYVVAEPTNAEYLALLAYGIDSGKTATVPIPLFGQTGGGTTYTTGTVSDTGGSANYSGTSYTMPTYGVVGTATGTVMVYRYNVSCIEVFRSPPVDGRWATAELFRYFGDERARAVFRFNKKLNLGDALFRSRPIFLSEAYGAVGLDGFLIVKRRPYCECLDDVSDLNGYFGTIMLSNSQYALQRDVALARIAVAIENEVTTKGQRILVRRGLAH